MASKIVTDSELSALLKVRQPVNEAWTLPKESYTEASVFQSEVDKIFKTDWLCVARQDQLAKPGDYLSIDLPGQPIVVVQGLSGALRAFSRICLHRSMPVIEGEGNATRFTCPYHNWTYELDGSLRSAPMMDGVVGFDTHKCQLPALQLETWQGFVFVNQDQNAAPLAEQLKPLTALLENYDFSRLEVIESIEFQSDYNWKILIENFMEAYHHIGIHKHTFQPLHPAKDAFIEYNRHEPWSMLRMPGIPIEEGVNVFPKLQEQQRHELFAACVYPTLLFAASASGGFWYQVEPTGAGHMRLRIHALAFPEVAAAIDAAGRSQLRDAVSMIHAEDIVANEGVWKGLQAGSTEQGRLSLHEESIWHLNQLWLDRMYPESS